MRSKMLTELRKTNQAASISSACGNIFNWTCVHTVNSLFCHVSQPPPLNAQECPNCWVVRLFGSNPLALLRTFESTDMPVFPTYKFWILNDTFPLTEHVDYSDSRQSLLNLHRLPSSVCYTQTQSTLVTSLDLLHIRSRSRQPVWIEICPFYVSFFSY